MDDLIKEGRRVSYSPLKKVQTEFAGESGRDTGGITRELWRLFAREVEMLCDGSVAMKVFRHDSLKIKVCC